MSNNFIQVTNILRRNEVTCKLPLENSNSKSIKLIECNQLAANHPVEDRLKVSQVKNCKYLSDTLFLGVFDGHGGSFCSDVISKRLFNYIALALSTDPVKFMEEAQENQDRNNNLSKDKLAKEEELINQRLAEENKKLIDNRFDDDEEDELTAYAKLFRVVDNLVVLPKTDQHKNIYDRKSLTKIRKLINLNEKIHLKKYAKKLMDENIINLSIEEKIVNAFNQCDQDMSNEIIDSLKMLDQIPISGLAAGHGQSLSGLNYKTREDRNLLKHFYLSLAVSGSCANVVIVQGKKIFTANVGDCRAVLGFLCDQSPNSMQGQRSIQSQVSSVSSVVKLTELSTDHNADNASEVKRVYSGHPSVELNNIIRHDRLLGQLMPLRAFGDFGYKWPVSVIRSTGLVKAFGPHVIPPFYETPPYLTAEPDIVTFDMDEINDGKSVSIVIATDGLWEQYSSREVLDVVTRYQELRTDSASDFEYDFINQHRGSMSDSDGSNLLTGDRSSATHLLRTLLSEPPFSVNQENVDEAELEKYRHRRLVSFLTLPETVVRNFRDDISMIILSIVK